VIRADGNLEKIGGAIYPTMLTKNVTTVAGYDRVALRLRELFLRRRLITVCQEGLSSAFGKDDVFEVLDRTEQALFDIRDANTKKTYIGIADALESSLIKIEAACENDGLTGVPTGLPKLDRITGGWQNSDLIIIGARPSMGKTGFALTCARNAAIDFKIGVAFFSLEMSTHQLVTRLISSETETNGNAIKFGSLNEYQRKELRGKTTKLRGANIWIDDSPSLGVFELKAKCRRLKSKHNIGLIIVDYLQLMKADKKGNREQEISSISRGLKVIAKELDTPVIALAQLSREVEKTTDKRPLLSHLRESGSVEQDADVVGFLYRPSYYKLKADDQHGVELDANAAEIIIAKHRNGAIGTALARFLEEYVKFIDYEQSNQFPNRNY
jgi:replicative DNA helicase